MNKVFILGNLTRDAEMKYLQSGTAVCNFGIAHNRKFRRQDGEPGEEVTFVDCEMWGKLAENLTQYLVRGKEVLAEGRLKLDQWQTQDGKSRSKLKVTIEQLQLLRDPSRGNRGDGARQQPQQPQQPQQSYQRQTWVDGDIPF